ncbi:winged helix-turn-helix domain-containing protein [Tahibacter amnicola]|uniref:Winged helix-turn-helix domain-containing protein n=1 Tax=Tahibacter amnicola TaxID=2976241 RepID=A0ABY6B8C4_9GAMM|nr:winged helix-turn-helix domain-containing protein [Tahibacter amnicola]UXI65812.1 winged helix-turn-helix domain-containing protein [Tahibacter amnicola]
MNDLPSEFRVGTCRVEPGELRLHRDGQPVKLEPRVLAVLLCLVRRAGRTVSRDDLLAEAWRGQIVSDDAINRAIWKLRAALAGDQADANVIETVPRLGYRLLWPVDLLDTTPLPLRREPTPSAPATGSDNAKPPAEAPPPASRERRTPWRLGLVAAGAMALAAAVTYRLVPDTSRPAQIQLRSFTHLPWAEYEPAFSPDGRRMVFAADGDTGSQLWVQPIDSATAEPLTRTTANDHSPAWSPTADRIAFVRETTATCTIELIPATGGESRTVGQCAPNFWANISFSADGRQLVISDRNLDGVHPQSLWLIDIASGHREELTRPTELHGDFLPRWSPDGRHIAFARSLGRSQYQLLRQSTAAEAAPEFILESPSAVRWLAWRDSERLMYLTRDNGLPTLWQWHDGKVTQWLTLTDLDIDAFVIAPDGRRAALVRTQRQRSIWQHPNPRSPSAASADTRPLLTSSREDFQAAYSPDGRQLAFASTRNGRPALWLADPDGSRARILWGETESRVGGFSWSPDSRRLVFERNRGMRAELCIVTLAGAASCLKTPGEKSEMPAWSVDGQWIYYTAEADASWILRRIRVDGTDDAPLVADQAYAATPSRDGQRVWFARVGVPGLWSHELATGREVQVLDDLPALNPRAYAEGADGLYYLAADGQITFRAADGQRQTLFKPDGIIRPATISLHPSGDWLLISRDEKDRGDISLVDNLDEIAPP